MEHSRHFRLNPCVSFCINGLSHVFCTFCPKRFEWRGSIPSLACWGMSENVVCLLYVGVHDKWWRGWGLIKTPRRPWQTIYRETGFAEVKSSSIFQRKLFHLSENGHLGKPLLTPLVCQDWELLPVLLQGRILTEFSLAGYLLSRPVSGVKWSPFLEKVLSVQRARDRSLPANLQ